MFTLVLVFMTVKCLLLIQRRNPLITQAEIPSHFDGSFTFDFHENNFRLAFGVRGFFDHIARDDPNFVRWNVILTTIMDGVRTEQDLEFHKCTQDDYDLFNPIAKQSVYILNELK